VKRFSARSIACTTTWPLPMAMRRTKKVVAASSSDSVSSGTTCTSGTDSDAASSQCATANAGVKSLPEAFRTPLRLCR
jgi:hypothetical protein